MNATEPQPSDNNTSAVGSVETGNSLPVNGCHRNKSCEPMRVVRQYINPAVYVESLVCDMAPFRRSPVFLNYSSDDEAIHNKVVKVKRCLCFSNPKSCPCHPRSAANTFRNQDEEDQDDQAAKNDDQEDNYKDFAQSASTSAIDCCTASYNLSESNTKISVKQYQDELKLSLASTSTFTLRYSDEKEKEEVFRNWCLRKDQERKLQEEKEAVMKEIKLKEKELQLQQERENFRKWLARKKKDEERKKKDKEKQDELEKRKQEEKNKRMTENELRFRLWLKKKEEMLLEKKIQEQTKTMKVESEKQQRLDESVKAYQHWLATSKNKPKPIPLNQGLRSLRSSMSVTYVNPTPWVPNIDVKTKPSSQ